MAEYINLPCSVCGKEFDENSDVVVCPVCGTPHHRDCYKQLGHCANTHWHEQNKFFDPELEKAQKEGEQRRNQQDAQTEQSHNEQNVICNRCGQKNNADAIFCSNCGLPISNGFGQAASNEASQRGFSAGFGQMQFAPPNPNEDFDGVEGWKLAAVVHENQFSFMPKFLGFKNGRSKVNFNFFAFFLSPLYFLYRKMYLWGILGLVIEFACSIPYVILMLASAGSSQFFGIGVNLTSQQFDALMMIYYFTSLISLAAQILGGLFANYLYYKKCKKTAMLVNKKASSKEEFLTLASKKGGVNRTIIIIYFALAFIASAVISSGILS